RHSLTETSHLRVAPDAALFDFAEFPIGSPCSANPYRTPAIFKEPIDGQPRQLVILSELPVLPACKTICSADPKSPIARRDQTVNNVAGKVLIRRRLPGSIPDTVEARQAELRAQPKIPVGRLGDANDVALG